ncbi:hypothetical protein B0H16DRAFT_1570947 [Mycena metata]|uniref:Uncharacterized protein n=1 Tax=Mycena metata TaxID=1033252 RepID=A0AAD7MYS4_9AGAR|nr:hypothetical protein B0H16DRAFT_1570947 [Mycena metata]
MARRQDCWLCRGPDHPPHRQDPECRAIRSGLIFTTLISGRLLAHLYNLHTKMATPSTPSMEGLGDVFEAYLGALALHLGFQAVLEWFERVLNLWVESFCADEKMMKAESLTLSKPIQSRHFCWKRAAAGAPPVPLKPLILTPEQLGAGTTVFRFCAPHDCRLHFAAGLPGWDAIDLGAVSLPESYPPNPPPVNASDLPSLADALTDVLCRLEFPDVETNGVYRIVGEQVFLLALTALAMKKLRTATLAELEEARIECANPALAARLGLILHLHRHFRTLRIDEDDLAVPSMSTDHLAGVFHAFLGILQLRLGWDALFEWLEQFLGPWVLAAGDGTLRASGAAEKKRRVRLRHAEEGRMLREQQLREGRERQRLSEEMKKRAKEMRLPGKLRTSVLPSPEPRRGYHHTRSALL